MVEVIAMSTLLFLVLTELSPGEAILILNGVFLVQTAIDVHTSFRNRKKHFLDDYSTQRCGDRHEYNQMDNCPEEILMITNPGAGGRQVDDMMHECFLNHYVVKAVALLLQVGGLVSLISFWAVPPASDMVHKKALIGLPFILLSLSLIWSNWFQEAIAKSNYLDKTARYKSSEFMSSLYRNT